MKATVNIPDFEPEQDLKQPNKLPLMRWVATLGVATDVCMDEQSKTYYPMNEQLLGYHKEIHTDWNFAMRTLPAQTIEVKIECIFRSIPTHNSIVI